MSFQLIQSDKIYRKIVAQIEHSLKNGQLSPGDRLPSERELASVFGVSRASVRQAMAVLEANRVVETKHGQGTFIREGSGNSLMEALAKMLYRDEGDPLEIVEARKVTEGALAAFAAERATPQDIEDMRRIVDMIPARIQAGQEHSDLTVHFHQLIAKAARNSALASLLDQMLAMMNSQLWRKVKYANIISSGRAQRYHEAHIRILNAIASKDGEGARKAMLDHLDEIERDLVS